ncbi:MAG: putative glycoside hydrolase, partial [Clostridium sp.]
NDGIIHITDDSVRDIPPRTPVKVKGIYVSAYVAGSENLMDAVIQNVDDTEINSIVIDFKDDDGRITTPIDIPVFNELEACKTYVRDMKGLVQKLKEHGIYVIARVVTFKDPYLAEKKPEWSLKRADGSLYRDKKGLAWVNPYKQEVWDYLIEVGNQAADIGFDEVQFDYIRFATDSTMKEVVFDEADTRGRSKTDIISEFTQFAYEKLTAKGLFVSADVFGAIIGSEEDAESVGQIYGELAGHLDYICPMIYPSHYGDGNFGLDHPDMHPYETILASLQKSREELARYKTEEQPQAIVRPWLQDFTASYLQHYIKYGDEEIREQIRAVQDAGYDEWILWSAANKYHYGGVAAAE